MQSNTPSREEINEILSSTIHYLENNSYVAVEAEMNGSPLILITTEEISEEEGMHPLLILPSPELVLSIVDPISKKSIFGIANTN